MSLLGGQPQTFSQAFPTIATFFAAVLVRRGGPMDGNPDSRAYSIDHPPGDYVVCGRASCAGSGWRISDIIREMVASHEASRKTGGICNGRERMSRTNFRACLTHFEATIEITYKPQPNDRDA